MNVLIRQAEASDLDDVRRLFQQYQTELGVDLCFQGFDAELAGLPGKYAAPLGGLFVAESSGNLVACAAFRNLEPDICELKRFYVEPDYRNRGLAAELLLRVVTGARSAGYALARLDTLQRLVPALGFYQKHGFVFIEAYYPNPEPDVVYMQLDLS